MGIINWLLEKPNKDYFEGIEDTHSSIHRRYTNDSESSHRSELTIKNIQIGDYVTYRNVDYYVRQRYLYRAGAFEWMSYQFSDVGRKNYLWLDVEEDDELSIEMSKPVKLPPNVSIAVLESKKDIIVGSEVFHFDEHGYAQVRIQKENKSWELSKVEYWDYADENETRYLSIERWGVDELEATIGNPIREFELEIYPGS